LVRFQPGEPKTPSTQVLKRALAVKAFLPFAIQWVTADKVAEARDELVKEKFSRGKERTVKGEKIPPKEYQRSGGDGKPLSCHPGPPVHDGD
jgi:hypothetical protein